MPTPSKLPNMSSEGKSPEQIGSTGSVEEYITESGEVGFTSFAFLRLESPYAASDILSQGEQGFHTVRI
ncbi:hypothetical protein EMPG_14485 [Blastomyces silverae]|uniref:Uncharacterized protein n=1 Tax=Blastomyces silverae TaxID=2060906 RepID=A0A0H1BFH0_9EURO|nr:hypothetical protein EMPG_14485 [Blastomyces silverae]